MNILNNEMISFFSARMGGMTHAAICCIRHEWTVGRENRFTLDSQEESERCEALAELWTARIEAGCGVPLAFYEWYKRLAFPVTPQY